jgi:hypothetical protein
LSNENGIFTSVPFFSIMHSDANNAIDIMATNNHYPILSGLSSATKGARIFVVLANILQIPKEAPTMVCGNN